MKQRSLALVLLAVILPACSSLPFSLPRTNSGEPSQATPASLLESLQDLGPLGQGTPAAPPASGLAPLPNNTASAEPTMVVALPEVPSGAVPPGAVPGAPQSGGVLFAPPVYGLQSGTPVGVTNFVHPEAGCNWSGVAGQAFDKEGNALTGMIVQVSGSLEGKEVLSLALTGATQSIGPGGYEVPLGSQPVASHGALWAQLFDLGGKPLTSRIPFDTYGSCDKALVLINFTEAKNPSIYFFPNIFLRAPNRR